MHDLQVAEKGAVQVYYYGRSGQGQNGVDIALELAGAVHWEGVQCKLKTEVAGGKLTQAEIFEEYEKSRKFKHGLERLIIATTCLRDVDVVDAVRVVNESFQRRHVVEVLFWADIEDLLERHESVAKRYYPERFSPETALVSSTRGGLRVSLQREDWDSRLQALFADPTFRAACGATYSALMMIVSELADNALHAGKGAASRVEVILEDNVLVIRDDGAVFDPMRADYNKKPEMKGVVAIRAALAAEEGISYRYIAADKTQTRFNATQLELSTTALTGQECVATGPIEFILSRDQASRFQRSLHIPDSCKEFTLRLVASDSFFSASASHSLLEGIVARLNGRKLVIKISQEARREAAQLTREAENYPSVKILYV